MAGSLISGSRIEHMRLQFEIVFEEDRYEFVQQYNFSETVFMGDGYWDASVLKSARIGIAPAQARAEARAAADYVTPSAGGEGAVMDACLFILREMGVDLAS